MVELDAEAAHGTLRASLPGALGWLAALELGYLLLIRPGGLCRPRACSSLPGSTHLDTYPVLGT